MQGIYQSNGLRTSSMTRAITKSRFVVDIESGALFIWFFFFVFLTIFADHTRSPLRMLFTVNCCWRRMNVKLH